MTYKSVHYFLNCQSSPSTFTYSYESVRDLLTGHPPTNETKVAVGPWNQVMA